MKKPNQYYKNPYNGVEVELEYDEVKDDWNIVLAKPPKPLTQFQYTFGKRWKSCGNMDKFEY